MLGDCDSLSHHYAANSSAFLHSGVFSARRGKDNVSPEACLLRFTANDYAEGALVDVGGNVGSFAAMMLKAFEAHPEVPVHVFEVTSSHAPRLLTQQDRLSSS